MQFPALSKQLTHLLRPKRMAILEACLIGLVSGLAAVLLKQGVAWLAELRLHQVQLSPAWLILPLIGLVGGYLSGLLVERFAPEAAGSGIPQVKAALGYVPIALDGRVALVKLASTLLSLGSGLTLGRQGPTVQIGAAIAAQLSRWVPTSPDYRRQLIAAGAAAGLAAAFNAPIAGVLFVVEELLQDVSGLTLGTAILASFVGAVVSRLLGGHSLHLNATSSLFATSFSVQEIPLFLLLGVLAGLLGALFCRGIFVSLTVNQQFVRLSLPLRIALAGLVSGLVTGLLPSTLQNSITLQDFWMVRELPWTAVLEIFVVKFLLTLVAFGSGAPGGLFAPSLLLGSALGYLVNDLAQAIQTLSGVSLGAEVGMGYATTYALAGMGAFFSAVTRGPITAIVIVFEMTTDFNLVLPLMIGSVVAYLVAESIYSGSIYKHLLARKGIHLEAGAAADGKLAGLKALDIMQQRVETLASQMTLDEAVQAFSRSHHRGFPVVDEGRLVGIVTQTDLDTMRERRLSGDAPLSAIMTVRPVTVNADAPLTQVLYLLNRYKISRLPVIERRKLVGIITRADIIRAESDQLSGTDSTGPRPEPSYVVYQTQSPATGRGRLLVPLANPQTAEALLQIAAAIARDRHYELECLQVIIVPRHKSPAETPVSTTISRRLLKRANRLGEEWQIPVHTQVRVTHDVAQAILETIKERHIDLVLMGWKGSTLTPGRVFGSVVDTIIRQAACEVVVVKFGSKCGPDPDGKDWHPEEHKLQSQGLKFGLLNPAAKGPASKSKPHLSALNRWLVPTAGGPNSQEAIQLLPALAALSPHPEIRLCQVCQPSEPMPDISALNLGVDFLSQRLSSPVLAIPVCASSVAEAIIDLAQKNQCDVILLGATREGLLQQVIKGNIPEEIARGCDCTVILVRGPIGRGGP